MVDRRYAGTPADFSIGLGPEADLVDENDAPTGVAGWTVLIPKLPETFEVYDATGTRYTDLLDHDDAPVEVISASAAFDTAGQILTFTVREAPDGDVYLVGTGGVVFDDPTFRVMPLSDEIFNRLVALETRDTTSLADWSDTPPLGGQAPVFDDATGEYVPTDLDQVVAGVASVNGQTGQVTLGAADVGAAPTAHQHSGADIASGTVDVARLPVGTSSWQVAAGNHTHAISGVTGLQAALDAKVNTADVAKVWPAIGPTDPTPPGAAEGDIIVRRQA